MSVAALVQGGSFAVLVWIIVWIFRTVLPARELALAEARSEFVTALSTARKEWLGAIGAARAEYVSELHREREECTKRHDALLGAINALSARIKGDTERIAAVRT